MTKQEAVDLIKKINPICAYCIEDHSKCHLLDDCEMALMIAIECTDKQIPRKPNKVRCLNGKFAYLCPTCGGGLISMCRCHYSECGQAIDWSDNE